MNAFARPLYRFHNKAVYLKAALRKMTSRSVQLNHVIDLEVDDVKVPLPSIKGLIILNISRYVRCYGVHGSFADWVQIQKLMLDIPMKKIG